MNLLRSFLATVIAVASVAVHAQVVAEPAAKTIKCSKAEVTAVAISPKGDKVLVALDHGAELFDLESGKKLYTFQFSEDESTLVYYCAFNDNGEYVVLIGYAGKREVWDVKTGKKEPSLTQHRWIPDPRQTTALGLKNGNSTFDRYYQQIEAKHGDVTAKAVKNGVVEFSDATGKVLQSLKQPENKDMHHLPPCVFHEQWFITGTDDGRVLFYTVR